MSKAKVAVLKVKPATILKDIERLAEMAGMKDAPKRGATTILKDNISWHYPFPAANTTPWQMEGTILALQHAGLKDISCVQNKTVVTNAFKGEDLNNYVPLFRKYKIPVLYNFKPEDMKWVHFKPKAKMHVLDKIFPDGIQVPGLFLRGQEHRSSAYGEVSYLHDDDRRDEERVRRPLGDAPALHVHLDLQDAASICWRSRKRSTAGLFAIGVDGTTAGNGPGPRTMFPVVKDYMLASSDQVAIDAVAAKMMGFDPLSLEFVKVAHDDGLGVGDPRDIEIVGADISNESWGFTVGDNGASHVGDFMWFGPMKRFQKLFFHTPLVNVFIMGSEAYHDYYRWPVKDKKTFSKPGSASTTVGPPLRPPTNAAPIAIQDQGARRADREGEISHEGEKAGSV